MLWGEECYVANVAFLRTTTRSTALASGRNRVFTISLRIAIILSLDGIMVPPHPGSGIKVARRSGSQRSEPIQHDLFFCLVLEMVRLNIH
jgi:hypothetical protein